MAHIFCQSMGNYCEVELAFQLDGFGHCWQSSGQCGQLSSAVEQLICNQQVVGSSPTAGSILNRLCGKEFEASGPKRTPKRTPILKIRKTCFNRP